MTVVYRISREEHVATALLGIGAAMAPGRWNSTGVQLAYTAASESLALLEMLVHINLSDVPEGRRLLTFDVPDNAIHTLGKAQWPEGWDVYPYTDTVRRVGDTFIASGKHLALRVPSAIARTETNVLINPRHPRFTEVRLLSDEPLALDPRLFA